MFNLASYQRILLQDFEAVGGRFEIVEFKTPADFARIIKEKTLVNCTGYGARALLGDTSVVPVRGQITRLISQADANSACATRTRRSSRGAMASAAGHR
jgi:glycine/D-amino acid oxidase-like deaminating enzyme